MKYTKIYYAKTLRLASRYKPSLITSPTSTANPYQQALLKPNKSTISFYLSLETCISLLAQYSNNRTLKDYIHNTKEALNEKLPEKHVCTPNKDNLTTFQRNTITKLKQTRTTITIKPADKNLGIVVMNTDDI